MIIPVKCFTCGKVIADKWEYYKEKSKIIDQNVDVSNLTIEDLNISQSKKTTYFDSVSKGKLLDELGLNKICCRRHMLGHVDLIDII